MNKVIVLTAIGLLFGIPLALADVNESFFDDSRPFLQIEDAQRQAEAWAMCSATYNLLSSSYAKSNPTRSKQLEQLAAGAAQAVLMSIVTDGLLKPDSPEDQFAELWNSAKITGTELMKTRNSMLTVKRDSLSETEAPAFFEKLAATLDICMANLEGQQKYIDMYREQAKLTGS